MAKRRAATELNRDNWDIEEEKEDPGTFTPVSDEELKTRIIRKAKRTILNKDSPNSGPSPFASFGFGKSTSNPNPFNFIKNNVSMDEGGSINTLSNKEEKKNGSCKTNEGETTDKQKEYDKSGENFGGNSETVDRKTAPDFSSADKAKPTRSLEYFRQLQSLNESVMKWMQLHLSKNSCCDFTPVFSDYKKHLDTLNFTYPMKEKMSIEKSSYFQTSASSTDEDSMPKSTKYTANHGSTLGHSNKSNDDETDYGANFKSNTTNTSTFSFGIKRTPTSTSSVSAGVSLRPTSSSKEEAVPENKPFQFSFGLKNSLVKNADDSSMNKPFSFATAPSEKNADSESVATEEEYVPPKNDFATVKEEDAFYSKRCKLFYKKDDSFLERGIGTLHLKPLDGKTQLVIRADTSLGNILLNIVLNESLPMSKTGKNNVLLVCVPNPPIATKKSDSKDGDDSDSISAIPMLIRVKTSEDADELLEKLNKHKS